MPDIETDRNLLFGVIALQSDLITMQQFVDACTLWTSRKDSSLAEVLVRQGWLVEEDRTHVEYLLRRRLQKAGPNVRKPLTAMPDSLKVALASIDSPAIRASLQSDDEDEQFTLPAAPAGLPLKKRLSLRGLHSSGGIGQVWLAHDEMLGRDVALKELKANTIRSRRNRERFFREAQLTGQLEHPGIVPVYDFVSDEDEGRCYYTMRFVKGRTLTEAIRIFHEQQESGGVLGAGAEFIRLLNAFVSVCRTVAYAHSRDVIHRDLKGDNIVLGDFGEVIVLDWGLAKRLNLPLSDPVSDDPVETDPGGTIMVGEEAELSPTVTIQGERLGTPAYMAPEQAVGRIDSIDRRTDVYGLAAILYEILGGVPPFTGKSIVEVLNNVIHTPPLPLGERIPGVPPELERICLQGLSKDRSDRQQSAADLADQVETWLADRAQHKRTEQERERFFNLSLDLLAIVNAQGLFTQTNPAWKSLLGWEEADLTGQPIQMILHSQDHHRLTKNIERILTGEPVRAVEHRCLCKDGSLRWVSFNANLIAGEGVIYIVGRDVTERKRTEQTFQELLESAPDAMVIVNQTGRIVLVNSQLEQLFGFSRAELLGQPIEMLVPDEVRARHPTLVSRYVAAPQFRGMASGRHLYGRHRDGRVFPAEISLSPVKTEQGLLVSCAVRDISHRQALEQEPIGVQA